MMSRLEEPSGDTRPVLPQRSQAKPTAPAGSCACCGQRRWWTTYREALFSVETLASLTALGLLAAGWVVAGFGSGGCRWLYLAAATVAGLPILRSCLASLRQRRISVEVLVALAILAAVLVGEFHAGAVVAVMLLGGGVLEQVTIARARRSLASLLANLPETVLVRRGPAEVELAVSELVIGDRIIARPGERLAVDGIVVGGESAVDESPITGESVPQDKQHGDKVFAGSINQSGVLEVEARTVGDETTLARIRRLVEAAQASQAPVQRIADKAAKWYVPAALLLAAAVWGLTGDVVRGITVLIVFCPCALVLATPTAIVASIGHAARRLMLVKGGEFAEIVGRTHTVGFDKTGTLTLGRPTVVELVRLDSLATAELLRLAASAERFSEHPLSIAIRRAAERERLPLLEPTGFRSSPGCGVEAQVDGKRVQVGRVQWLEAKGVVLEPEGQRRAAELEAVGHTVLAVATDGRAAGLIAVRDVLRAEAREAVSRLKAQAVRPVMLTGDNERAARVIAAEAGIEEVHSGLLPEDKLRLVREWQGRGQRVSFLGDGINDAPAMAAADVGLAMGAGGTAVAVETSDIAFLSDDLTKMAEIIALSRRTLKVIRQNIAFSVVLNLLSVLAAGLGWISPIGGAVLHESGAMAVILNAMRLLR
jgi:Cd2+/Zn2+-exporting ATPase